MHEASPTVPEDVDMHMVAGNLASLNLIDIDGPPWFDEYTGEQLPDEEVQKAKAKELDSWAAFEAVWTIDERGRPSIRVPASAECLMGHAGCRERLVDHSAVDLCEFPCRESVGCGGGCGGFPVNTEKRGR